MALVIINQFDGGQAEDIRTFATNEQETSYNFDIYTKPQYLVPYIDMIAETTSSGTITDYAITDVDAITVAGTTSLVALGRASLGSANPHFFRKSSSSDITSSWQSYATGVNNVVAGSLVVYKGFAYCLGDTTAAHNLQKFDGTSSVSTIGTLAGYSNPCAKPFVHPEDNKLYMGSANIISRYDGTTFTATALTLPDDKMIVSLTSYGGYLAIACRPKNGVGNSVCYLWDVGSAPTTVQSVMDLGAGQVNIVENLYNNLFFTVTKGVVGSYSSVVSNILSIKGYAGGAVETIKEVTLSSSLGTAMNVFKQKRDEHLYFAFSNDTAIYRFGRGKNGSYFLSHDRAYPSGTTTVTGFSLIGDFMWLGYSTNSTSNLFWRTRAPSESQAYTTTSTYKTTINPSMPLEDRYKHKQLEAVAISFTAGATCNFKYSVDGSAMTSIIADTTASGEITVEASALADNSPFLDGREYQFQAETTGNGKIKEIRYKYRVLASQLSSPQLN